MCDMTNEKASYFNAGNFFCKMTGIVHPCVREGGLPRRKGGKGAKGFNSWHGFIGGWGKRV